MKAGKRTKSAENKRATTTVASKVRAKAAAKSTKRAAKKAATMATSNAVSSVVAPTLSAAAKRAREKFLLEITSLPTAAGREDRVIERITQWVNARSKRVVLARDCYGNLIVAQHGFVAACAKSLQAGADQGVKPIMITAHLDHPAFVVTAVRVTGARAELDLEFRGGVNDPYFVGSALEVFDAHTKKSFDAKITALDAKTDLATKPFKTVVAKLANSRAAKSIAVGSIARWKFAAATVKAGVAHTHACDDLAAVAAALEAFDEISRDFSREHVALLFTRSEEIGFIGAIGAARAGTIPTGTRLICLENSRSFPHDSPMHAGPIVRVGDRLSVFTPQLTNRVGDIAAAHAKATPSFRFQRKLMPGGACEATAFATFGLASTCVCLPLGNYHNMHDIDGVNAGTAKARVERECIAVNDYHWLVELLGVLSKQLDDETVAPSHRALMDTLWSRHGHLLAGTNHQDGGVA